MGAAIAIDEVLTSVATDAFSGAVDASIASTAIDTGIGQQLAADVGSTLVPTGADAVASQLATDPNAVQPSYNAANQVAQQGVGQDMTNWGWNDYLNAAKTAQSAGSVLSGIAGLGSKPLPTVAPTTAQIQADPWSRYRSGYGDMLNALMINPALTMTTPGYQFQLQQGLNAMQAGQAARGQTQSGGALAAQQVFGQNYAMSAFNNLANMYGGMAGAGQSGATGSQALLSAQQQQNAALQAAQNAQMSNLGTIAGGLNTISNIYGKGGTPSTLPNPTVNPVGYGDVTSSAGDLSYAMGSNWGYF
jgi:hypothetical protein